MNIINELYKTKYYIYEHYLDGKVFYVGKGKHTRGLDLASRYRSPKWNCHVNNRRSEVEVKIIAHFNINEEALAYEKVRIKELFSQGEKLVNVPYNNCKMKPNNYTVVSVSLSDCYLDKPLTAKVKEELCLELNIVNKNGTVSKWVTIKQLIVKNGYNVEDTRTTINGKRLKTSIITKLDE